MWKASRKSFTLIGCVKCAIVATMISTAFANKLPPGSVKQTDKSFTNPGTNWCGDGNVATHYDDLGTVENVDKCCRDHDHCLLSIPAGTWKYGLYNNDPYTNSDCNCDSEFRSCLKSVSGIESIAAVEVGLMYFTFIKPKCFFAMYRVPCEKPYYNEHNKSFKHDGAGKNFCARWYDNVAWQE